MNDVLPDAPAAPAARKRKWLRMAVFVVLALLWVRVVLFEFVFPAIERQVDNPELDADAAVDPDAPDPGALGF